MVSTKDARPPRWFEEVQEVGFMMIHGEYKPGIIKVAGLPYHRHELVLDLAWVE